MKSSRWICKLLCLNRWNYFLIFLIRSLHSLSNQEFFHSSLEGLRGFQQTFLQYLSGSRTWSPTPPYVIFPLQRKIHSYSYLPPLHQSFPSTSKFSLGKCMREWTPCPNLNFPCFFIRKEVGRESWTCITCIMFELFLKFPQNWIVPHPFSPVVPKSLAIAYLAGAIH